MCMYVRACVEVTDGIKSSIFNIAIIELMAMHGIIIKGAMGFRFAVYIHHGLLRKFNCDEWLVDHMYVDVTVCLCIIICSLHVL